MRPRKAPTKGGGGRPSEGRGVVTSARADAPADGAAGDAAADGHIRRTPAVRDAVPSLQVRGVRTTAMRGGRRRRRRRIGPWDSDPTSCGRRSRHEATRRQSAGRPVAGGAADRPGAPPRTLL